MNFGELTAPEFNVIADAIMMAILVVGVAVGVFAEARLYRRVRNAGMQHHYWWPVAAMLSILMGMLVASVILPGGDWESRRAILILGGALLAVVAVLRIALTKRIR